MTVSWECCIGRRRGGIQESDPEAEQQIREIFQEADRNGDGVLDKKEIHDAFRQLGSLLPTRRTRHALRHVDANGDGVISEDAELNDLIKYALDKYGYKFK